MSRETLLDAIAGREAEAFDRTIDVYVGRLRRKIAANPKQPPLIVTVPGVGYRLAAQPRGPRTASRKRYGVRTRRRSTLGPVSSHPINRANSGCDARARSAPYAEDATVILADRILSGRASIEEAYGQAYERFRPHPSKLEHAVAMGVM
jgi:hypothetical protein